MRAAPVTSWFLREVIRFEGSSRPVALLRIAIGAAQWAEHADRLAPHRSDTVTPASALFFVASTAMIVGISARELAFFLGIAEMWLVIVAPEGGHWEHHHTWLLAVTTL